jgi:uncharacterized protein YigE (DUF2233 family)
VVLLAGSAGGFPAAAAPPEPVVWDRLTDGLDIAVWNPQSACGDDVPVSLLVKIDPDRFRFSVYQYLDENLSAPLTIREWHRRTGAAVLFNGGLFREDYSYLGLLLKNGRALEAKPHQQWQGLFAAEPVDPALPKARVMDLGVERFSAQRPAYREAAQSLMLLDRTGKPRVRRTGKRAHQTAVVELQDGHVMLVKTGDLVPLWELASCLREQFPTIRQAMAMDGGASSDLLISDELLSQWDSGADAATRQSLMALIDGNAIGHIPLPTVIGVLPRP